MRDWNLTASQSVSASRAFTSLEASQLFSGGGVRNPRRDVSQRAGLHRALWKFSRSRVSARAQAWSRSNRSWTSATRFKVSDRMM